MKQLPTIYKKIQYALNDLPGEVAHKEMFPTRRVASEELKTAENYRISAVLALFYEEKSKTKLILTQRNDYKGSHGGQISFPGGKMEDWDDNTIATALRETHEEIGIPPSDIDVLGKLTDVYIPVSKFLVHPYIGFHQNVPEFVLSTREVKEVIPFDLELLLDESTLQKRPIKLSNGMILKDIPCFIIDDRIVWGATALMLNEIKIMLK
ncbi:MAG: CoA pyrophosphatase [Crocinitomicaceae bacterium]|nr:CoA pyrophosphatase [Crocinitomicaceae bacterium]